MGHTIPITVTQASLNQTAFDLPRNMNNILAAIDQAAKDDANILALEELTLTGYDAGDMFEESDNTKTLACLYEIAAYAAHVKPNLIVSIGHPFRLSVKHVGHGLQPQLQHPERRKLALYNRINRPFNVQSLLHNGQIIGMTAKTYLFDYERGYERRYHQEWNMSEAVLLGGQRGTILIDIPGPSGRPTCIPFGRPVIQITDGKQRYNLMHLICEEKWVGTRFDESQAHDGFYGIDNILGQTSARLGKAGLVALIPDASPPAPLKIDKHRHLAKLASQFADVVFNTDGLGSSGSTFAQYGYKIVTQNGDIISYGPRLSHARVTAHTSTVHIQSAPYSTKNAVDAIIRMPIKPAKTRAQHVDVTKGTGSAHAWDAPDYPFREEEETLRMNSLWLYDYMRKNKRPGIMQALSGGADSAYNSVLLMLTVRMAITQSGIDGFCADMKFLPFIGDIKAAFMDGGIDKATKTAMDLMLSTVYLGTDNSSDETRNAAHFLIEGGTLPDGCVAEGIGGQHTDMNIQPILNAYPLHLAVPHFDRYPQDIREVLRHELAQFLNTGSTAITPEALSAWEANLRAKHPEIAGPLISAAKPAHGLAYESIQASARLVIQHMLARLENKMPVANPNLSEAENGYTTFGGDEHSGVINPNGYIHKDDQLKLMNYVFQYGLIGICPPVLALGLVLKNKPSAELQPKGADGTVTQNDEDALQRSFQQINFISSLMNGSRNLGPDGRRFNAEEIFNTCKAHTLFDGLDDYVIFNKVAYSYQRWWLAQHKIHAAPIAPTNGRSVDHQTSRRMPNTSGENRADIASLGLKLVFNNVAGLKKEDKELLLFRAVRDEDFITTLFGEMRGDTQQAFRLERLEAIMREKGPHGIAPPLSPHSRLAILYGLRKKIS